MSGTRGRLEEAARAEAALLAAARSGDADAFAALVAPHREALHLHCYRMLASLDDADEALQDTLVRAWRGLDGFEGRAPMLHWLYRIATTTCLKAIAARGRRPEPVGDVGWLQPYPDHLLDQVGHNDPALAAERGEHVALAFIVALQRLPASQRAVLLLREVLSFSSREVAALLDTSVPAVNSALQRARSTLGSAPDTGAVGGPPRRSLSQADQLTLDRFVDAWRRRDIPALAALLREDAILSMPPERVRIAGRDEVVRFFAGVPAGGRLDRIRLVPTRANRQPALAAYLPDDRGSCRGYGIMVLTMADGAVASITGFPDPDLFKAFGLPAERPA
jgi:RNA polymerase sigma-70 factor (ECF subfamily)